MEGNAHIPVEGIDQISGLPQELISNILIFLPIRDAVRTSILSSKWKYAWCYLPVLKFDDKCRLALKEKPWSDRLMRIVDHVLFLSSDFAIREFVVSNFIMGYNLDMDKWIIMLSRKGVECLELKFYEGIEDANLVSPSLFHFKRLRELTLHNCTIEMPFAFQGFKNLMHLELKSATLYESTINNLIPLCPSLSTLDLEYGNQFKCLHVNAKKLKHLSVLGEFKNLDFVDCLELEQISIGKCNRSFSINRNEHTCNMQRILGCLPSLVNLLSQQYFMQFLAEGTLTDTLPNSYFNLKKLDLSINFNDSKQTSVALSAIKNSPNLEYIRIEEDCSVEDAFEHDEDEDIWNNVSDFVLHQLKYIKFCHLNGKVLQMGFLKFILANSPALQSGSISFTKQAKEEKTCILESLKGYYRASSLLKNIEVDNTQIILAV